VKISRAGACTGDDIPSWQNICSLDKSGVEMLLPHLILSDRRTNRGMFNIKYAPCISTEVQHLCSTPFRRLG